MDTEAVARPLRFLLIGLCSFVRVLGQDPTPVKPIAYSPGAKINYVRAWDAVSPDTSTANVSTSTTVDKFRMTTQYCDGLGRPIQTVVKGISPLGRDLVTPVLYDEFGRATRNYLSFTADSSGGNTAVANGLLKLNPFEQQVSFYGSANAVSPIKGQGETYFYSQTVFELSSLNRVTNAYAAGDSWIGAARGTGAQYLVNQVSDSVRLWTAGSNPSDLPSTSSSYNPGELFKNVTIDENSHSVVEYKDKEGRLILKKVQLASSPGTAHVGWLCTYYVYDDLSELRFVLQPKAVELVNSSWSISNTIRDELCFYYGYDGRGRMTVKKVPGAGEVWMVYDGRDRLVMTQDANLRANNIWLVTMYDDLNRPVKTGLYNSSSNRSTLQSAADASPTSAYPFNQYNTPPSGFELLTQTGYDAYDSIPSASGLSGALLTTNITGTNFFTSFNASPDYAQEISQSFQTKGLSTWSAIKVLGATNTFLYTVSIYDEKGRTVQVKRTNISGGTDVETTQYDFSGKVIRSHVSHQKSGSNADTYQILTKTAYDAGGRLLNIKKRVNSSSSSMSADKTTVQNTYNELGQLQSKKLGADYNSNTGLETLTYDYNIRGWMLGVNRDYVKSTSSTTNYFGFDLGYDKTTVGALGSYAQGAYNGNITGTVWKSKGDGEVRKYDFTYDNINRLTGADFNQYTGGFNKTAGLDFSVSSLAYDANGNILSMNQRGWKVGGSTAIDQLQYTYKNSGVSNQLLNVIDASNDATTKLGDFHTSTLHPYSGSKTASTVDYSYDANGNLTQDLNKDLVTYTGANGIEYNYLNLPQKITVKASGSANKGTIEYVYDAAGNKLKKITTEGSTITTTLYMLGNYQNDTLQFLPQEEGRIRPTADANNPFAFDYMLKDHLGNVRMVLTEEAKQDIYPAATLEGSLSTTTDAAYIEKQYYNINAANIVSQSSASGISTYQNNNGNPPYNNNPNSNTTANSAQLYKLTATSSGGVTGLGMTLKVMSGDRIDVFGKSYYYQSNSGGNNYSIPVIDVLTGLFGAPTSIAGSHGATASTVNSVSSINTNIGSFLSNGGRNGGTTPKAAINYLLLDEQFNYVAGGFSNVGSSGTLKDHASELSNIPVTKNGYLYLYVSNESPVDVFFDNLQVVHTKGAILEETHYYPFGLRLEGICSKAAGSLLNKNQYNGKERQSGEFSDQSGLDWYDYGARMYDNQIGRWMTVDPKSDSSRRWSPYAYALDNPIRFIDPDGKRAADPGDKFKTANAAALDFGKLYNDNSIAKNKEIATYIVKVEKGGQVFYTYLKPNEGSEAASTPKGLGLSNEGDATVVARAHAHGSYIAKYDNNNFSQTDITNAQSQGVDSYVATPNGSLQKYDNSTGNVSTISTALPSDPNDPARQNTINPVPLPKNEPTFGAWDWIKRNVVAPVLIGASKIKG